MKCLRTACLVWMPALLQAQTIPVIDDDFDTYSSRYTATIIVPLDPEVNFSYIQDDQLLDPGPPSNTFAAISHFHDVERDSETNFPLSTLEVGVQSIIRNDLVIYDPAVFGQVQTLDFQIDYRTSDPFSDIYFFIQRGVNGAAAGFTPVVADGQWQTLSITGVLASDFGGLDYEGSVPFRFGFGFLSSGTPDPFGTDPLEYIMEVDDFRVGVTPVPEPGLSALLICGMAFSARRRR